ncbi:MAG: AraC family transcriptional regulator [Pseudolabrys sp.]
MADLPWEVRSRSTKPVQHKVSRALKPYRLTLRDGGQYDARYLNFSVGQIEFNIIAYGDEVSLDAGQLGNFSILQRPLRGSYISRIDGTKIRIGSRQCHLIVPGVPIEMDWSPDCVLLVVRFPAKSAVELGLEAGQAYARRSRLGLSFDLASRHGQSIRRSLDFALREGRGDGLLGRDPGLSADFERVIVAAMHSALGDSTTIRPEDAAAHRTGDYIYVKEAETWMMDRLRMPISASELARELGVSQRTLSAAFRKYRNMAPLSWHRITRLDRCYHDLSTSGSTDATVTDIAINWGFEHMGRFAQEYMHRFGELPRQTLRRSRRRAD